MGDPPVQLPALTGTLGRWLAISVILFPVLTAVGNVAVAEHKAQLDAAQARDALAASTKIEADKAALAAKTQVAEEQLQVSRLFLDSYQKAAPAEQSRTIEVLVTLYPERFVTVAKLFHTNARSETVRLEVQTAEANAEVMVKQSVGTTADPKHPSAADRAASAETEGFAAVINGDLTSARAAFGRAYSAFPLYHNVDEIYNRVLTSNRVTEYQGDDAAGRRRVLASVASTIVTNYSWGATPDVLQQLRALARTAAPGS